MTVSERKKKYNAEWDKAHMTRILVKVKNDFAARIKERAAELGKPVNRYIVDLIKDDLGE